MAKVKSTTKKGTSSVEQQLEYSIVGKSKTVQHLIKQIKRLGKVNEDVLIIGEAGVGKGAIGRNIHAEQSRRDESTTLTSLNLAVIDDKELGSILFGFEQGASGYQRSSHKGLIESSTSGTLLVEEIEGASLRNQMKILKFIKERKDVAKNADTDFRLIITAKSNPQELRENNKLLEELADELSKFEPVEVPPLREHPEDIPLLVEHFTQEACRELGIEEPIIDINAIDVLVRQRWKENIRELKSVIDRSVLFSTGGMFTLPPELTDEKTEVVKMINNILTGQEFEINKSLDIIERGIVERALERFGFNQSKAAQFLGMTEQTLRYRLKRLGLIASRQRIT
jgi:DNA-binding NtrC family response regulator